MRVLVWLVAMSVVGVTACFGERGVGDPCLPARPPPPPSCGDGGCFQGSEIYVETRSVQCRTHVCIVNHWDEEAAPEQRDEYSYCTCRCGGPGAADELCACPEGFDCMTVFITGEIGLQGAYCVRHR
jgi:hypothetical protein